MKTLWTAFVCWLADILRDLCNEVAEGFNQRDGLRVASNIVMIVLYFLALLAGCMGTAWVIVKFKNWIILAGIVTAVIAHFVKQAPAEDPSPVVEPITAVQERAERLRKPMTQAAFALLNDLRIYLPGLPSMSLNAVEDDPPYIINPARTIIHHLRLMKGRCEVDVDTIAELLETIIDQHLRDCDLPLPVVREYPASTGEKAPGLVVVGVYDMADHYRVDLAITDDAEAAAYNRRHAPKMTGVDLTVQDEDF